MISGTWMWKLKHGGTKVSMQNRRTLDLSQMAYVPRLCSVPCVPVALQTCRYKEKVGVTKCRPNQCDIGCL